jgi:hypothetical protein
MTERRRYVLTKIKAGDYLLPSNDAQTLWRIARDEREGWSVWRWADELSEAIFEHLDDWGRWECMSQWLRTRGEAIDEAMRMTSGG